MSKQTKDNSENNDKLSSELEDCFGISFKYQKNTLHSFEEPEFEVGELIQFFDIYQKKLNKKEYRPGIVFEKIKTENNTTEVLIFPLTSQPGTKKDLKLPLLLQWKNKDKLQETRSSWLKSNQTFILIKVKLYLISNTNYQSLQEENLTAIKKWINFPYIYKTITTVLQKEKIKLVRHSNSESLFSFFLQLQGPINKQAPLILFFKKNKQQKLTNTYHSNPKIIMNIKTKQPLPIVRINSGHDIPKTTNKKIKTDSNNI